MNSKLLYGLIMCETDVNGAMRHFAGDETLYVSCLNAFLEDRTLEALDSALDTQSWDDAFTAAHALKGLAGNMGFIPLFHETGELVMLIRAGKTGEVPESFRKVERSYREISAAIRDNKGAAI